MNQTPKNLPTTARRSNSQPPAPIHYALEGWLAAANSAVETGDLNSLTLPSGPRSGLMSRRDALRDCLTPCSRARAGALLASLIGMAARAQSEPGAANALAIQALDDLSDVSEWALSDAVRAFRVGELGDGRWRPTTGELRIAARKREAKHREELWKLNRLLDHPAIDAPPVKRVSPDQFAKLKAMAGSFGHVFDKEGGQDGTS